MKRKIDNPDDNIDCDWRINAVSTLSQDWLSPYTGVLHQKGVRVLVIAEIGYLKGTIKIGIPNTTAMFLNLSHQLFQNALTEFNSLPIKRKSKLSQILTEHSTELNNFIEYYCGSIVFAYTAIESFTNEIIPEDYIYERKKKSGSTKLYNKEEIERWIPLEEKLIIILPEILNTKFTKRKKSGMNLKNLKE